MQLLAGLQSYELLDINDTVESRYTFRLSQFITSVESFRQSGEGLQYLESKLQYTHQYSETLKKKYVDRLVFKRSCSHATEDKNQMDSLLEDLRISEASGVRESIRLSVVELAKFQELSGDWMAAFKSYSFAISNCSKIAQSVECIFNAILVWSFSGNPMKDVLPMWESSKGVIAQQGLSKRNKTEPVPNGRLGLAAFLVSDFKAAAISFQRISKTDVEEVSSVLRRHLLTVLITLTVVSTCKLKEIRQLLLPFSPNKFFRRLLRGSPDIFIPLSKFTFSGDPRPIFEALNSNIHVKLNLWPISVIQRVCLIDAMKLNILEQITVPYNIVSVETVSRLTGFDPRYVRDHLQHDPSGYSLVSSGGGFIDYGGLEVSRLSNEILEDIAKWHQKPDTLYDHYIV